MPQRIVNGWQNIVRVESVTRTVSSADHASDCHKSQDTSIPSKIARAGKENLRRIEKEPKRAIFQVVDR
jgi:hypothetical protein